jgi:hypothetical protein
LEEKTQQEIQQQINRNKKIKTNSGNKSKKFVRILEIALYTLFILSLIALIIERFNQIILVNWIRSICWIILTVSGVMNIITGFNVISLKDNLFDRLSKYYENKIKSKLDEYK